MYVTYKFCHHKIITYEEYVRAGKEYEHGSCLGVCTTT
jgi:hypothetical protein